MDGARRPVKTIYPEGRDPLLLRWHAGEREPHPRWTDPQYWEGIALLHVEREQESARQRREFAAKKETPQ